MSTVNAVAMIDHTTTLIEKGWVRDSEARAADGTPVSVESPEAVSWCLFGGLCRAAKDMSVDAEEWNHVVGAIGKAILVFDPDTPDKIFEAPYTPYVVYDVITEWNDKMAGTKENVIAVLKIARVLAETGRAPEVFEHDAFRLLTYD